MSDTAILAPGRAISFGPFRLLPAQQLLLEAGKPVRLGSRALDILVVLVERAGELVSKEELVARVWPDTFVEEGNLRVHVAALRRALGDGQAGNRYVANIPGRGYRFVAPVSPAKDPKPPTSQPEAIEPTHYLPAPLTRMVGRGDIVSALVAQLPQRRFITIVGPGGIGKTTVALAVADELTASYEDKVRFVDLAPLANPLLVPSALASVLGLQIQSENILPCLIALLRDKQMLLVLDSCEHVIDAAAALAEDVFKGAPGVHILATSREPLRAEGERVQRLPPLGIPLESAALGAAEALGFPAVQLFVERATASLDTFELSDANAPLIAEICCKLDGIPLAIELAAGRVDAFGVAGIAARLDDRFRLLMRGRRTALPRHRTLRATLDWSHDLLPESERMIFRRLAVFAGGFALHAAASVAAGTELAESEFVDGMADLVTKSLVTADVGGPIVQYRLLDTTRAYALERLVESGELEQFAQRHAEYYRALFERAEAEWTNTPAAAWIAAYRPCLDNLRAALDWAFSPASDAAVGVALTVAAVPLWFQLSLIDECRGWVERALAALQSCSPRAKRREMQLHAALGWSLMYTTMPGRETGAAWTTALALAEELDDTDYRLRALWGLWAGHINNGEFGAALELARQFCSLAAKAADPADLLVGDRMTGAALHFLGDQTGARRHIDRMLSRYVTPVHGAHVVRFQFDQRVTASITLARILWLQGFADQAMRTVESSIDEALSIDHTLSLCNALAQAACPVALLAGDLASAERFITLLLNNTARHGLDVWRIYGGGFQGELLIKRGDLHAGLRLLRRAIDELRGARFVQYHTAFLGVLAEGVAGAGQLAQGAAAIDEALERCERMDERWGFADLLRIKGEIVLQEDAPDAAQIAEAYFLRSLDWARRQEALSWELRTATSLARLRRAQGRIGEARDLLASVYDRFSEGFGSTDLTAAKALLAELT